MKQLAFLILTIFLLCVQIKASEINNDTFKKMKPATILKVINILENDIGTNKGNAALSIIINVAEIRDDLIVLIESKYTPWMKSNKKIKNSHLLLGAYVAGNIKKQLEMKIKKDCPVNGVTFMLKAYKKIKKKNLIEPIKELDEWSKLNNEDLTKLLK